VRRGLGFQATIGPARAGSSRLGGLFDAGPDLAVSGCMRFPVRVVSEALLCLTVAGCVNGAGLSGGGDGGDQEVTGSSRGPGAPPLPLPRGGGPGSPDAGAPASISPPPVAPTAGACGAAGATCTGAAGCCSNRCEPVTGVPRRACGAFCVGEGAACTQAQDCCSLGCFGGKCVTRTCTVENEACKSDGECCSNLCREGRCQIDRVNRDCRPTGEDCTSGTGRGCCSNVCNERTKRCDHAPASCRTSGATCEKDGDCCRGTCDPASRTCKTPPPAGVDAGGPAAGGMAPLDAGAVCVPLNGVCAGDAACCSGFCLGGRCDRLIP
jgi:hypothetical protein